METNFHTYRLFHWQNCRMCDSSSLILMICLFFPIILPSQHFIIWLTNYMYHVQFNSFAFKLMDFVHQWRYGTLRCHPFEFRVMIFTWKMYGNLSKKCIFILPIDMSTTQMCLQSCLRTTYTLQGCDALSPHILSFSLPLNLMHDCRCGSTIYTTSFNVAPTLHSAFSTILFYSLQPLFNFSSIFDSSTHMHACMPIFPTSSMPSSCTSMLCSTVSERIQRKQP